MASVPAKSSVGSTLPSVKYPILLHVIQEVADGKTPYQACKDYGISMAALRHHLANDDELQTLFKDALDTGSDALAEMLVDIDKIHSNPAMASVISKNIQWLLERRKPEKFGPRLQVSLENNATKALIEALDKAIDRIPMASGPRQVTDVTYEVIEHNKTPAVEPASVDPLEKLRELGLA